MSSEQLKRDAAAEALKQVEGGMKIGLGTGSTAKHFVELLAERMRRERLQIVGVPTSEQTRKLAADLGIPLTTLDAEPELDLTVDGADEFDPALRLIKGGGAALLREKIVAAASRRMIVIADQSKQVEHLGRFPLPIEVNPFGLEATRRAIIRAIATTEILLRKTADGSPLVTDGGHLILDAHLKQIDDPEALDDRLLRIPGVVEHGLFIGLCQAAFVARPDGVAVLSRTA